MRTRKVVPAIHAAFPAMCNKLETVRKILRRAFKTSGGEETTESGGLRTRCEQKPLGNVKSLPQGAAAALVLDRLRLNLQVWHILGVCQISFSSTRAVRNHELI